MRRATFTFRSRRCSPHASEQRSRRSTHRRWRRAASRQLPPGIPPVAAHGQRARIIARGARVIGSAPAGSGGSQQELQSPGACSGRALTCGARLFGAAGFASLLLRLRLAAAHLVGVAAIKTTHRISCSRWKRDAPLTTLAAAVPFFVVPSAESRDGTGSIRSSGQWSGRRCRRKRFEALHGKLARAGKRFEQHRRSRQGFRKMPADIASARGCIAPRSAVTAPVRQLRRARSPCFTGEPPRLLSRRTRAASGAWAHARLAA